MRIHGLLFDGQSSRAREAVVSRSGQQVLLEYEGKTVIIPIEDVQVSSRLGSAPRALEFPGLMRFETSSHDQIDQIFGRTSSLIHKLENNMQLILISAVALGVFLVVSYIWIIPSASRFLAHQIPQSYIDELAKKMEGEWGLGDKVDLNTDEQDKLDTITSRLTQKFPENRISIRAVEMQGMANAFALPDGTMMVTPALLDLLTTDQALAVMMHEMGHVVNRHGIQALAGQMIVSVLLFFTIGATDISNVGQMMLSLSYSRGSEKEADLFAARNLKEVGLKAGLLADALKRIERSASRRDGGKVPTFMSTHPLTEERAKYLREFDQQP